MTTQPHAHGVPQAPPPGCPAHAAAGNAVQLLGPRFHTDPTALYREMRREHGPVVPVLLPGEVPAWLVVGYREMYQVTGDPALFPRDPGLWNQWPTLPEDWPLRPMIGNRQPSIYYTVGDEHQRHLDLVQSALERISLTELRKHAEQLADELIDRFSTLGQAEIIAAFAKPLPILVLARILGFPDSDGPALIKDMGALADGGADAIAAHQHFGELINKLVESKRDFPGADVASYMIDHPAHFTDEEYRLDLMALTAAGYLTTADWIGNSVRLMLTDDRFAASLTGGQHSVHEAMNEVLWEDTPTQILAGRWAARDTSLGGQRVGAGDLLLLGLQGANSDPETHTATATSHDGLRNGNFAHFAFSHGEFQCPFPAREIAELIARAGIEVLLDRLPDIDLAVPPQTLTRRPSPFLRGLTVLPVQFSPTPAVGGRS